MNFLKIATLLLTLFSCSSSKTRLNNGIYHYVSLNDSSALISRTVRLNSDSSFAIYGMKKMNVKGYPDSTENYIYVSFGLWSRKEALLILNSYDPEVPKNPKNNKFSDRDFPFLNVAEWNSMEERVIIVKNDSFLITDNGKKLKTVKDGIILEYQPGK